MSLDLFAIESGLRILEGRQSGVEYPVELVTDNAERFGKVFGAHGNWWKAVADDMPRSALLLSQLIFKNGRIERKPRFLERRRQTGKIEGQRVMRSLGSNANRRSSPRGRLAQI